MVLELDKLNLETTQLHVAIVKLARGVHKKLSMTSKSYAFICPEYLKVDKGDWVVVEVKRKTQNKNKATDFRVGKVEEILVWNDREILTFRPYSFIVGKVDCDNFEDRCKDIKIKKYSLWARYNAVDRLNPDKNVEGVPMNIFDKLLDNNGKLHFDKLDKYSKKLAIKKKELPTKNKKNKKTKQS